MSHRLVCITGLVGAGKSVVSDYFVSHENYLFFRFGQLVLDEVKKRGQKSSEALEKQIREELRAKYGMAAMAILNLDKLEHLLKSGDVIADNLISFEEYKVLKDRFGDRMTVIAVYAPPKLRYQRVSLRKSGPEDVNLRNHEFTAAEAAKRDEAELKNLNNGATIAMADYTLINTGDLKSLYSQIAKVVSYIKL
jgi:dephospho-CoA kinase